MAHAGHTLTGPKPDNWISCRLICDACEGNAHPLSFLVSVYQCEHVPAEEVEALLVCSLTEHVMTGHHMTRTCRILT